MNVYYYECLRMVAERRRKLAYLREKREEALRAGADTAHVEMEIRWQNNVANHSPEPIP